MLKINGSATVFKLENKNNYVKGSIRTVRKDKRTNEFISSFFNAKFIGEANQKAQQLQEKEKIKITDFAISNEEYGTDKKKWCEVAIFNFDFESQKKSNNVSWEKLKSADNDDGLPF